LVKAVASATPFVWNGDRNGTIVTIRKRTRRLDQCHCASLRGRRRCDSMQGVGTRSHGHGIFVPTPFALSQKRLRAVSVETTSNEQRQTNQSRRTCRFRFQINWSDEYSCWTLRGGAGHGEHCGRGSSIDPNVTTDQDTSANDVAWQQAQDRWVQQCCFTDYLPLWQEMATLANANFTVYQAVIKGMYELRDAMRTASTEATLAAAKSLATSTTVGRTLKRAGTLLGPPTKKKKKKRHQQQCQHRRCPMPLDYVKCLPRIGDSLDHSKTIVRHTVLLHLPFCYAPWYRIAMKQYRYRILLQY
jgi:hypothetical protein